MNGPVLKRDLWEEWWVNGNDYDWMCSCGLAKFFTIPKSVVKIRLFAVKEEREDTWKVTTLLYSMIRVGEEEIAVTGELWEWLSKQVKSGRRHVGVELLSR